MWPDETMIHTAELLMRLSKLCNLQLMAVDLSEAAAMAALRGLCGVLHVVLTPVWIG